LVGSQKGVLHHFGRIRLRTRHAQREAVQPVLVPLDQLLERVHLAALGTGK
jgi:hypothetical protein